MTKKKSACEYSLSKEGNSHRDNVVQLQKDPCCHWKSNLLYILHTRKHPRNHICDSFSAGLSLVSLLSAIFISFFPPFSQCMEMLMWYITRQHVKNSRMIKKKIFDCSHLLRVSFTYMLSALSCFLLLKISFIFWCCTKKMILFSFTGEVGMDFAESN